MRKTVRSTHHVSWAALPVRTFRGYFQTKMRNRRGGFPTAMAVLLALAVIVDVLNAFSKPLPPGYELAGLHRPASGIVVFGVRRTGAGAAILALLVAAVLFFCAAGIWRMQRYAVTIA
jgi:hypothetical protein